MALTADFPPHGPLAAPDSLTNVSVTAKFVWFLVALCLAAQLYLQFVQQINWDEFYFLARIYEYQRGELDQPLQNFHVHLFGWLTSLPGNDVFKIEVARTVMWAVQACTLLFIHLTARPFVSHLAAAMAVLAFVTAGSVLFHGTSFRTDPIAACLVMLALTLLVRSRLNIWALAVLAIVLAVSFMVTIKVAFFAPALAAAALWRLASSNAPLRLFAGLAASAIGMMLLIALLLFLQSIAVSNLDLVEQKSGFESAYSTTLQTGQLFPALPFIVEGIKRAPVQFVLLCVGLIAAIGNLRPGKKWQDALLLLLMASPVLSLAFYRNAYPYYYAFIFPSAMVLAGYAIDRLNISIPFKAALAGIMAAFCLYQFADRLDISQDSQNATLNAVYDIFPEEVAYIDRSSMIAGYPKRGFFMSTWGMLNYHRNGRDVFADILRKSTVPLVINNAVPIDNALNGDDLESSSALQRFSPQDIEILRQNYVPHWGHIWVAGKQISASALPEHFEIRIPGTYTVEATQPVEINGVRLSSGDTLVLERGRHVARSQAPQSFVLRWGDNLPVPSEPVPENPIFLAF